MKRSPHGKTACQGSGTVVSLGFGLQSPGATIRRACPQCGQSVRVERRGQRNGTGSLIKHTRLLTVEEWAERKAAVRVDAAAPRSRPSALAD